MADGATGAMTGIEGAARAQMLLHRQSAMESDRYNFETTWQRVADLIDVGQAQFQTQDQVQGQRRDFFQFDSTGALALERFAAAMESMVTPRTQRWCRLVASDKRLRDNVMVQRYLDEVNDILFAMRYAPTAGFTTATYEHYRSLGAYGSGAVAVMDDMARGGFRYQAQYLGNIWYSTNFQGEVDTVHRKFEWDARKAKQAFGDGPKNLFKDGAEKAELPKFHFVQCIAPSEDYNPSRVDKRMAYLSEYVCVEANAIVESKGYFTKPIIVSRFATNPRETYGRGPATLVLNSLNTVNEMQKTLLRAGQQAVHPPLLLPNDDVLRGFNMKSGALNYGGLDDQGNPMVRPLENGANMPIGLEMIESERRIINDAFFVTLFQILVESPQMTATEALLRAQEKGALLAPPMGRQQTEFIGPIIQRELDIAIRQNRLPPMPRELEMVGGMIEVEYSSPLNLLQQSDEAVAVIRSLEAVTQMAQIEPGVLDGFNLPAGARIIAQANGAPGAFIATDEEIKAKADGRAQAAQAEMLLKAAPAASQAALNMAKAQEAGLSTPDMDTLLQ